jgi:hypothetical protein
LKNRNGRGYDYHSGIVVIVHPNVIQYFRWDVFSLSQAELLTGCMANDGDTFDQEKDSHRAEWCHWSATAFACHVFFESGRLGHGRMSADRIWDDSIHAGE